jgi:hypothetical protein
MHTWYKATLLPPALNIFTDSFYTDEKSVFISPVPASTPNNHKVIVASRMAMNSFRMVTADLAKACFDVQEVATPEEMKTLDSLCSHLNRNL